MRWKNVVLLGVLILVGLIAFGSAGAATVPVTLRPAADIRLKVGTFTPAVGETLEVPAGLEAAPLAANEAGFYIVQFHGPVRDDWRAQLEAAGAILGDYIPDYALKVRMTPAQAEAVANINIVSWVGRFLPAYKISPAVVRAEAGLYTISLDATAVPTTTAASIQASGATLLRQDGRFLITIATPAQVDAIARIEDVAWIENFVIYEKHNDSGAGTIIGSAIANANGYTGATQVVAIADTGLGGGTPNTAHADIPSSRIDAIFDWGTAYSDSCYTLIDDGPIDVDSGHGTHVALSAVSDGNAAGIGTGSAPGAHLIFQAVEDYADFKGLCSIYYTDGYYLLGLPTDIYDLFLQAYSNGARIHSNSWGSSVNGDYTDDSARADAFIWDNPDMLITFSAGNSGTDANGNGIIDNDSIGSPATAKNVLTVGASENQRTDGYPCDTGLAYTSCAAQGGLNSIFTWGSAWPADYPANPIANDPSAGNAQQMAAFSSRGPTDDGRIKPDIVAPGSWILSGYSDLYQQGYDASPNPRNGAWQYDGYGFPYDNQYKYLSGTSMSNPIAAGGAAVVRDFYQIAESHSASAALVKATLINSAVDMLDENNDGVNDNDYPIPNVHEGWGLINVANATDGSHQFVDNATGVGTNGTAVYQYGISSAGSPFKVTLVWSDYPSTAAAAANLVNDLDLTVTAPNGTVYRGNVFGGGWSVAGGSFDRINNVENVYVQSAAAGTWTVQVSGFNVAVGGTQPFALVVDGQFGTAPTPTNTAVPPTSTPTSTAPPPPTATNTPTATATNTPGPTVTNTPVPTNTPTPTATNTPQPAADMHMGDLDGNSFYTDSRNRRWAAEVDVLVVNSSGSPVSNASVSGNWVASGRLLGSTICTTNASGRCIMSATNLRTGRITSVAFSVTNVTHATLTYNPSANSDPDGDSNGTTITILQP